MLEISVVIACNKQTYDMEKYSHVTDTKARPYNSIFEI